jgi:tyrosine-protein phosphatase SIW14
MSRLMERKSPFRTVVPAISAALLFLALSLASSGFAQNTRKRVEGVQNFGQVTDRYFRGGAVTPDGVDNLAAMGVKTIIDLRDKPSPGEPEACKRNGIRYHKFGLNGSETPDEKVINEILSIVKNAKEPVYVHCSAGKHRAGTIAALYRIRVQGWSLDKTWAEQQSYGFGPAEEHPELYAYVYGNRQPAARAQYASFKPSRKDDDDDKDKSKKSDKVAKSKKDDDDDDDDDEDDAVKEKEKKEKKSRKKEKSRADVSSVETQAAAQELSAVKSAPEAAAKPASSTKGISAEAGIITTAEAIKRAQAEGGSGDVLKVDLEYDQVRSIITYDVTFSTGNQYEFDATTGKYLGVKTKAPAKLAVLTPLAANGQGLISFKEIIRKAETQGGQSVMEMELKRIKGRSETRYEVVLADGAALAYDAETGKAISDL